MASFGGPSLSTSTQADWSVYTGGWINWTHGMILGSTLTTSLQSGLILVAFIAMWVGLVGGHFWGIVCYAVHNARSSRVSQDGLHHQQQAVIRNSSSATATSWLLMRLGWTWRDRAEYSFWRVLPLIALALLHVLAFAAAGIFSSRIFSTDHEVILQSPSCGFLLGPQHKFALFKNQGQLEFAQATLVEKRTAAAWALNYARSCYTNPPSTSCDFFAVPKIQATYEDVSCPFDPEICIDPNVGGSYKADTGFIDANHHLGINVKEKDSVKYRRITTCAPIKTSPYVVAGKSKDGNEIGYAYLYGPGLQLDPETGKIREDQPYSFSFVPKHQYLVPYPISSVSAYVNDISHSSFVPIKPLQRTDADVTLLYVNNNIFYGEPVHDLWFNATEEITDPLKQSVHAYIRPEPQIIVMGCTEQHQMCNSAIPDEDCPPPTGWEAMRSKYLTLEAQEADGSPPGVSFGVGETMLISFGDTLLDAMSFNLGTSSLLASLSLESPTIPSTLNLPDNQWRLELKNWVSYSLALMQKRIVSVASGPADPTSDKYVVKPPVSKTNGFWDICDTVKIRDGRYYSFSALGLGLILSLGALIIATNLWLPSIIGYFQRRRRWALDKLEDWELDHLLQIQRMAYENSKLGQWTGRESGIPVTTKAAGKQTFGKPGRGVGIYEPLETQSTINPEANLYGRIDPTFEPEKSPSQRAPTYKSDDFSLSSPYSTSGSTGVGYAWYYGEKRNGERRI